MKKGKEEKELNYVNTAGTAAACKPPCFKWDFLHLIALLNKDLENCMEGKLPTTNSNVTLIIDPLRHQRRHHHQGEPVAVSYSANRSEHRFWAVPMLERKGEVPASKKCSLQIQISPHDKHCEKVRWGHQLFSAPAGIALGSVE